MTKNKESRGVCRGFCVLFISENRPVLSFALKEKTSSIVIHSLARPHLFYRKGSSSRARSFLIPRLSFSSSLFRVPIFYENIPCFVSIFVFRWIVQFIYGAFQESFGRQPLPLLFLFIGDCSRSSLIAVTVIPTVEQRQ